MRLDVDYLLGNGFSHDEYSDGLIRVLFDGMEDGVYMERYVKVYPTYYVDGKMAVEISNDKDFVRIYTDSVERVNQALSFLKIRERI